MRLVQIRDFCSSNLQPRRLGIVVLLSFIFVAGCYGFGGRSSDEDRRWDSLPFLDMRGGLKVFWNVIDGTSPENRARALKHGFSPITLIDAYSDNPGGQKESIARFVANNSINPWNKPEFFERTSKRNIAARENVGTIVQDIEFVFNKDVNKAWNDAAVKAASGESGYYEFEEAYLREWASWYWLPLAWVREKYPDAKVGLYGLQPFWRDYWGIARKNLSQINEKHQIDGKIWKHIDPHVDFYVSDIYIFYDRPDSVYYMAANVEANYIRTREFGQKPIYSYESLRYSDSHWNEGIREINPYLAEAMAVIPFFSGARGLVLWGFEPKFKVEGEQPFTSMPVFMKSLERVSRFSEKIAAATLVIDEPAHMLWQTKRPLVRRLVVNPTECIVMAINPWQEEDGVTNASVSCGPREVSIEMKGRATAIYHIEGNTISRY